MPVVPAPEIAEFIEHAPPEHREAIAACRAVIYAAVPQMDEAIKWRRPTYTVGGDWHHWICAIGSTRAGVTLMFHKGALLDDPGGALAGDGRYMRQVRVHRSEDIDEPALIALIRQAVTKQREMRPAAE